MSIALDTRDRERVHSHGQAQQILGQYDLSPKDLPALTQHVGLIARGVEMDQEEFLALRFSGDSAGKSGGQMAFDLLPVGKRALEDQEIRASGKIDDTPTVIRVTGNDERSPVL